MGYLKEGEKMTYCVNRKCPHTDCERHLRQKPKTNGEITIANFDGTCKRQIIYLAEHFWQYPIEAEERACTMTDCYFNNDLKCTSPSSTWNPDLLDNCPDYTED